MFVFVCVCGTQNECNFFFGWACVCSVSFHTGYNTDVYTQQIEMRNGSQLWPKKTGKRIWVVRQSIVTSLLCSLPTNCFLLLSNPLPSDVKTPGCIYEESKARKGSVPLVNGESCHVPYPTRILLFWRLLCSFFYFSNFSLFLRGDF